MLPPIPPKLRLSDLLAKKKPSKLRLSDLFKGVRRKVFISYFHAEDEFYRILFDILFGHLFINKSVKPGEITEDLSTKYIKRLIQEGYLKDTSVLVVLVGPNTYKRKHVDWEISASLMSKVGGLSGLLGLCLPNHPDYGSIYFDKNIVPPRLVDNITSGYANFFDWNTNPILMNKRIEEAFNIKNKFPFLIKNNRQQFIFNRS